MHLKGGFAAAWKGVIRSIMDQDLHSGLDLVVPSVDGTGGQKQYRLFFCSLKYLWRLVCVSLGKQQAQGGAFWAKVTFLVMCTRALAWTFMLYCFYLDTTCLNPTWQRTHRVNLPWNLTILFWRSGFFFHVFSTHQTKAPYKNAFASAVQNHPAAHWYTAHALRYKSFKTYQFFWTNKAVLGLNHLEDFPRFTHVDQNCWSQARSTRVQCGHGGLIRSPGELTMTVGSIQRQFCRVLWPIIWNLWRKKDLAASS